MKNGEKAQGKHEAYAAWAFSAKFKQIHTKDLLNDDGKIGKVTICDNEILKRERKKNGGNRGKERN